MDVNRLTQDLKFASQLGVTLNLEERVKLELGLLKLNEENKYEQILFWGKIEGTEKDYYIALGLNFKGKYEFPQKSFFFSSDDFKFEALPSINPEHKKRAEEILTPFKGNPVDAIYTVPEEVILDFQKKLEEKRLKKENNGDLEDTDDEEEEKEPQSFLEKDRLAYVVRAIDNDCATLPIGALKLTPLHELRHNDAFKGLSIEDSQSLNSYQHFRPVQSEEMKEFINKGDAIFHAKFLDALERDLPDGVWSIHTDSSKLNVTVRNLLWPGYFTYHRATTNIYGFCYFGTGLKNTDLAFLI